jgi:Ca2+-binding EF-hand superfamily protein
MAFAGASQKEFQLLDADKNGFLSTEEYQKINTLHKDFAQADKDGDGKLSVQEYKQSSVVSDDPVHLGKDMDVQGMLHNDVKKQSFHNPG